MFPLLRPITSPCPLVRAEETDALRCYLQAIAHGDAQALNELHQATHRRIHKQVLRMLENREDAEEVVVDTYWQVWRTAASFSGTRGTVQSWMSMIARTRALDRLRARSSREKVEAPGLPGVDWGVEGDAGHPEQQTLGQQQQKALRAALEGLPGEIRTLVELAFFGEMSHSQIAVSVGQPLGTVKTKIRRGLQLLVPALAPYRGGAAAGGWKVSEMPRKAKG